MKRLVLGVLLATPLVVAQAGCRSCRCYSCCPSSTSQPELAIQQSELTNSGLPPVVRLAQPLDSVQVR